MRDVTRETDQMIKGMLEESQYPVYYETRELPYARDYVMAMDPHLPLIAYHHAPLRDRTQAQLTIQNEERGTIREIRVGYPHLPIRLIKATEALKDDLWYRPDDTYLLADNQAYVQTTVKDGRGETLITSGVHYNCDPERAFLKLARYATELLMARQHEQ